MINHRVALLAGIGLFLLVLYLGRQQEDFQPLVRTESLMDTFVTLKGYGPPETARVAIDNAFKRMQAVDAMASFHKPDSELSRLNRERSLTPTPSFFTLFQLASDACFLTNGHFDPTFAVLHRMYGFYDGKGRLPTPEELAGNLDLVGWNHQVTCSRDRISLASGALIDLGGIGGGFAIEEAILAFRAASCTAFFIDDGGDLWMEGRKPDGKPWKVGVKDPRDGGFLALVVATEPIAVSTSGDYERFVEVDGRRICHILDPKTGLAADYYRSVTVVASSPFLADILSTALFAMPPEQARIFAGEKQIPALFLPASGSAWMTPTGQAWFADVKP